MLQSASDWCNKTAKFLWNACLGGCSIKRCVPEINTICLLQGRFTKEVQGLLSSGRFILTFMEQNVSGEMCFPQSSYLDTFLWNSLRGSKKVAENVPLRGCVN